MNSTCIFGYDNFGFKANNAFLAEFFSGNVMQGGSDDSVPRTTTTFDVAGIFSQNLELELENVQQTFHNVAEAMTGYIRQNPDGPAHIPFT